MTQQVNEDKKKEHSFLLHELTYEATNQCVQCGYCLPACPTYLSMGNESQSPRGRINLVKMAAEGKLDLQEDLKEPLDFCLDCRACEVACPVGVPYGEIYEAATEVIAKDKAQTKSNFSEKTLNLVLNQLFPYKNRLRLLGNLTWIYQFTKVNKLVQKTKLMHKISEPLAEMEAILPEIESPRKRYAFGSIHKAKKKKKMTVAFFPGCVMDAVMSKTNRLTIELLQKNGCDVIVPENLNCCGALHAHQGNKDRAKELAKANIKQLEALNITYIINNAGGCGAMLEEYDKLLKDEQEWAERAKQFTKKSKDITEVLVELGPLSFETEWNGMITYQDSCHLRNVQGVTTAPRQLLNSIPGATFIEMKESNTCCGSGGIYNVIHYKESMDILDGKMVHAENTDATTIVTTNPGCLLQMRLGIKRSGLEEQVEALHLVEVLAEASGIN